MRDNLEAACELANCRSAQDLVALQSRITRENLQRFIDTGQIVAQSSSQAIADANGAMQAAGFQARPTA